MLSTLFIITLMSNKLCVCLFYYFFLFIELAVGTVAGWAAATRRVVDSNHVQNIFFYLSGIHFVVPYLSIIHKHNYEWSYMIVTYLLNNFIVNQTRDTLLSRRPSLRQPWKHTSIYDYLIITDFFLLLINYRD